MEVQERIRADREGDPYLLFRDAEGGQRIVTLAGQAPQLTIGRAPDCDVTLEWDAMVSRAHARLERLGKDAWMLVDDGLSQNGTVVNGQRMRTRQRLMDGDVLRFGDTCIVYRAPLGDVAQATTLAASSGQVEVQLSPAQRRVLIALCRPYRDGSEFAKPASNQAIAEELVISVEAVKSHLRALFEKFAVGSLARDAKRAHLVQRAFETGVISRRDL